ncbi:glycosyltransferase family 1 protein [Brooklawnia cerclae]|uniref:Alpha-1,6-mannosyltransferase n=1 Tax=Brooklawnia cerclae TaxID=349934 RepID=A0ABX0SBU8_9ACTN|nr:glycosyltransferase [Brooklawnia cerclae]NIH55865.1 alpha-1,6-mannosyltransferase [Brooklawnia cerclae]
MGQLRIAQLANFVGPTSGGMKVAIDQLGKGYVAAGAERVLLVPGARDLVTETADGIIVQVRSPRVSSTYRMVARPWRALDVLKRFRPTSVECSDKWTLSPVGGWARRRGVGSVLLSHERLDDMLAGWLRSAVGVESTVGALNRRLAREFDVVVVTSDYSAGDFEGTGANLVKVPLGVDLDTFTPTVGEPDPGSATTQLCYVGRMSHEKYPQLAVATAVELHRRGVPVQLHMYGTGPDASRLRRQAGHAPVFFHGHVSGRGEMARRFARSHISLSVCPTETFGLAVLEALACGTPVVTSDRGGAHELVDATCGEWAPPDPYGLADAVQRLIARLSPGLRSAARARAEQFGWQRSVEAMLSIHSDLGGGL